MDLSSIISSCVGGLVLVVAFFLKNLFSENKELKVKVTTLESESALQKQAFDTLEKNHDELKQTMWKKFSKINSNHDKQREENVAFREMLANINGKLDLLIKRKGEK